MSYFGRPSCSTKGETHYCIERSILQSEDVRDNRPLSSLSLLCSFRPFVPYVPSLECVSNTRLTQQPALPSSAAWQRHFLGNAHGDERSWKAVDCGALIDDCWMIHQSVGNSDWMAWNGTRDFRRWVSRALENQGETFNRIRLGTRTVFASRALFRLFKARQPVVEGRRIVPWNYSWCAVILFASSLLLSGIRVLIIADIAD